MSDRRLPEPDDALRLGLEALPVPEISAGFDDRVLSGLRRPNPWWQSLLALASWPELRPLASGAACALVATLGLYAWSARLPLNTPPHPIQGGGHSVVLERMLDRIDTGDLTFGPSGEIAPYPKPRPRLTPPAAPLPRTPGQRSERSTVLSFPA